MSLPAGRAPRVSGLASWERNIKLYVTNRVLGVLMMIALATVVRAEPTVSVRSSGRDRQYMKPEEFRRHFNQGIDYGRPMLNAVFDGRIKPRSDKWIVPIGLFGCGNGPNAEFVLGRMY